MIYVVSRRPIVKVSPAVAPERGKAYFVAFVQALRDFSREVRVSIAVFVGIVIWIGRSRREARFCRVKALGLEIAEIQAEGSVVDPAVDACACRMRIVGAGTHRCARLPGVFSALGENLYDSTDRIGSI